MTKKERGLIMGALRRVFSRSALRLSVIEEVTSELYKDSTRPRVTKWCRCNMCEGMIPRYLMVVDHIIPVIPVEIAADQLSFDEIIERMWCDKSNLQGVCKECHDKKSAEERTLRIVYRKKRKQLFGEGESTNDRPKRAKKTASKSSKRRGRPSGFLITSLYGKTYRVSKHRNKKN